MGMKVWFCLEQWVLGQTGLISDLNSLLPLRKYKFLSMVRKRAARFYQKQWMLRIFSMPRCDLEETTLIRWIRVWMPTSKTFIFQGSISPLVRTGRWQPPLTTIHPTRWLILQSSIKTLSEMLEIIGLRQTAIPTASESTHWPHYSSLCPCPRTMPILPKEKMETD